MKNKIKLKFIVLCFFGCSNIVFSQKASDILEKGISVPHGAKLFLNYVPNDKKIEYDIITTKEWSDFITLEDSMFFLVRKNAINLYIQPMNPLNYSFENEIKVNIDPINQEAANSLSLIIEMIGDSQGLNKVKNKGGAKNATIQYENCQSFDNIVIEIQNLESKLKKDQREEIIKQFKALKNLDFTNRKETTDKIEAIKSSIKKIELHFTSIDDDITDINDSINSYSCDVPEPFIAKKIFKLVVEDLKKINQEQQKRLENLKKAFDLVNEAKDKAIKCLNDDVSWCFKINQIPTKEGNISILTIKINESGFQLSDENEIVSVDSKKIIEKTIYFRKFQRFVPEVSVGTVYTFFKYNTYGTVSDETGQQFVSTPTENEVRNLNISTMINFNYYISNSNLHPLYQIGIGLNSGVPSLLTGFGLRSNINGLKRLTITGGIAMTWTKELSNLKVGDPISGTDDIEKDLASKFSWPPKPYVGIQYNF